MRYWLGPSTSFHVEPRFTRTDAASDLNDIEEDFTILFGFDVLLGG